MIHNTDIITAKQNALNNINELVRQKLSETSVDEVIKSLIYTRDLIDTTLSNTYSPLLPNDAVLELKNLMVSHIDAILLGLNFREVVLIDCKTGEIV